MRSFAPIVIPNLEKLKNPAFYFPPLGSNSKLGSSSRVHFTVLLDTKAPVAISQVRKYLGPEITRIVIQDKINCIQLLEEEKVDLTFIHHQFLYRDRQGATITETAQGGTFKEYILEILRTQPREKVKDIFKSLAAQLISAVAALHEKGLVHRDIKPENILIMFLNGKPYLQLADLEFVAKQDSRDLNFTGTPGFLPMWLDVTAYTKADKKSLDCTALAKTLLEMYTYIDLFRSDKVLNALLDSLNEDQSRQKQIKIDAAFNHPYFGNTPAQRQEYFAQLRTDFPAPVPHIYPKLGDFSLITPAKIKDIRTSSQVLLNPDNDVKKTQASLVLLQTTSKALMDNPTIPEAQTPVKKIFYATGLYDQDRKMAAECVKKLTCQDLLIALNQAVKTYTSQTLSCWARLFHGETGKARAHQLQVEANKLKTPQAIFQFLYDHLEDGPGNWRDKSFKTYLTNELGQLSFLPMDQWFQHLSIIPENAGNREAHY